MGYVRYLLYVILYSFVALVEYIVGEWYMLAVFF
jgi:hypothetical protein